jgi:hypothetical protein
MAKGKIIWERDGFYILSVPKGYEIYKPHQGGAIRCGFVGTRFGLGYALTQVESQIERAETVKLGY